jgi:hypothetical protein
MLSSITPLGERTKGNRWATTVAAHMVGSTMGGVAVGTAAWAVGTPVRALVSPAVLLAAVIVATVAAAVLEARPGLVPRLPGWRRQVDERWLTMYRGVVYGAGYGVQLGAAVATIVTTAAIPLVLIAAAATPPFAGGAALGALFGLARGAALLAARRIEDPVALRRFHERFEARAPGARRASAGILAAGAVIVAMTSVAV